MSEQASKLVGTPNKWSTYAGEVYRSRKGPQPLGTVVFDEIEEQAREKLKDYPGAFMYADGNAGVHQTFRANRRAFEKFGIIPRMLVDATIRDLSVNVFGKTLSSPLLIAPVGAQHLFHPDGEIASAKAAGSLEVPYILSAGSSRTMEEVATANGSGERWFQLYWPHSEEVTDSLLNRARTAGYTVLVVTVDTMIFGWRTHDINAGFRPVAHGIGVQIGASDPVFMNRYGLKPITETKLEWPYIKEVQEKKILEGDEDAKLQAFVAGEFLKQYVPGKWRTWEDFRDLRKKWEGPIVLKGLQSVADVEKALEYDIDGVVVSNHGGRQLDGAIPSLYALERIAKSPKVKEAQQSGKLTLFFDSGIRTGPDIFKALALGAQAVFLGRPWIYGMTVAGQAGVEQVIRHTLADFDNTLAAAGYPSIADIQGKGEEVLMKLDF